MIDEKLAARCARCGVDAQRAIHHGYGDDAHDFVGRERDEARAEANRLRAFFEDANKLATCGHRKGIIDYDSTDGTPHCPKCAIARKEAECAALRAALEALRIDANRLCDRNIGGTYEDDCRRSIARADAALARVFGEATA